MPRTRSLCLFALLCVCLISLSPTHAYAASPNIVISQVYGGGGASTGATYANDYVELFNLGSSDVDVTGWTLQYTSASGPSGTPPNWIVGHSLSGIIQPGHYYLIKENGGSSGDQIPNPDFSDQSLSMSATDAKVALVRSANALSGTCPISDPSIVDFVGFGSANCYEGTHAVATLSKTTAAIRTNVCSDTDNNSSDFSVAAPTPHNGTSPTTACSTSTPPSGVGTATPASVDPGNTTLLTVTVTPGANPTSTGMSVTADLQPIGGPAAQPFTDNGDNTCSYTATVPVSTTPGLKQIDITISDSLGRSSTTAISLTVNQAPLPALSIHNIQGSGNASPMAGQPVTTIGIVTSLKSNGFYLEAPDAQQDADPATSEGIFVYTGSTSAGVAVGDSAQVTGTVSEYGTGAFTTTEITNPSVSVLSSANTLPTILDIAPSPDAAFDQLARYDGMLVRISNPKVVGPTGGSTSSDGKFYVTASTVARPFRQPGLEPTAATITGMPSNVPHFDGNPERVLVDTSSCSTKALVAVGDTVPDVAGPLGYSGTDFAIYPGCPYTTNSTTQAVPLPDPATNEFTVASFNMLNFTNNSTRLAKASMAIRNIMKMPDIIGVEEMKDLPTLQALATQINSDATAAGQPNPGYTAALVGTDTAQNVGFLYGSRVTGASTQQVGDTETIPGSTGSLTPLNDRPPFVLTASITPVGGTPFPVTVIVNHLRSLIDVDANSATGDFVRRKRKAQAEYLAGLIALHQSAGEKVISVGDYNSFEFNDGYVDVLGTVKGQPTPSDQVLMSSSDLIDPDLTDLAMTLPANARYSYVEGGNAQTLDHIVVTGSLTSGAHLEVAHIDADFPESFGNDASRPERVSDHDPVVGYFVLPASTPGTPSVTLSATTLDFGSQIISTNTSKTLTITNSGTAALTIAGTAVTGSDFSQTTTTCAGTLAANASCTVTVAFAPTATGSKTGTLTITDDADGSPHMVALVGKATDFSIIAANSGSTSASIAAGQTATYNLQVTGSDDFSGAVTLACAGIGASEKASCTVTPTTANLSGTTPVDVTVKISTTAATTAIAASQSTPFSGRGLPFTFAIIFSGLGALVLLCGKAGRQFRFGTSFALLLLAVTLSSCGGDSKRVTPTPTPGTPAGTYNVTITATANGISRTIPLTLKVN